MRPTTKYWLFLTAIVTIIFTIILGSFIACWYTLSQGEQAFFASITGRLLPYPLLGAAVLVAILGTLMSLLFQNYIIPILQLAEKTRLISAVNPHYRIKPRGAREVVALTQVINQSADAFQRLQTEVDERIRAAQADLEEERTRLAALMSELPSGVLVCNTDGQILLYNPQSQKLLQADQRERFSSDASGLIGLGRSIFGLLDRNPIAHALELLHQAVDKGQQAPISSFMTTQHGSRCLRINMAPVFSSRGSERKISGFVLTLEDMTSQMEADTRRDMLIQSLTDNLQTSLDEIRSSISTILNTPELNLDQLTVYRKSIDRASLFLQEQLGQARKNYARHLQELSKLEVASAENLLEVIGKNLRERYGLNVRCILEQNPWLQVDSYLMVQAVSHLAGLLKTRTGIETLQLTSALGAEGNAQILIGWPRAEVSCDLLSEWKSTPLITDGQGRMLSFRDVISGNGGDVTSEPGGAEICELVRLSFPVAQAGESSIIQVTQDHRPICYEFDLFHQPLYSELGRMPLRKLTCVVFDTETTGLNPSEGDEIIQVGAIRMVNGRLLYDETIDQLVDPQRSVPEASVAIHGIQPKMLQGQPTIDKVLAHFHQFAEGAVLVAHNAAFDMRFLELKEQLTGLRFNHPVLDTLLLSSIIHPNLETHSLEGIAERLNLTIVGRHTALGDAIVTGEVLVKLIPLLEEKGIHTLEDAIRASAQSPFAKIRF